MCFSSKPAPIAAAASPPLEEVPKPVLSRNKKTSENEAIKLAASNSGRRQLRIPLADSDGVGLTIPTSTSLSA